MQPKTVRFVTALALLTLVAPTFAANPDRAPAATSSGCPSDRISAKAAARAPAAKRRKPPVAAPAAPRDAERELWRHQGVG